MQNEENTLPDFETTLSELETLIEKLESGDMTLEKSLEAFEHGVKLTRQCQTALKQAEQKVSMLTSGADGATLETFNREN